MTQAPRISFEHLPTALQTRLRPRVERLGYLGEFFRLGAYQPEALAGFIDFTEALKSALDARLVEVIALTVASETSNAYELAQHERLAVKIGMSAASVQALVDGRPGAEDLSPLELAAARLAREVSNARGRGCPSAYRAVEELGGYQIAVGCLMAAGRYLAHATIANTWELPVPAAIARASEPSGV